MSDITNRLKVLGYEKRGCFEHGYIEGRGSFGERGYTVFAIVLDVPQGTEVVNKRGYPNPPDLNNIPLNVWVEEMELALEIIYCYREWKGEQNEKV